MSEKNWKKEDQVVLGRWEIPSEIREAIVAPQICKECYNKLSQKYDMEKAFVPDDEKHVVNFIFFVEVFYLKDIIVGYFIINNKWLPKDKKLFKSLKDENIELFRLCKKVIETYEYKDLINVYKYIFI